MALYRVYGMPRRTGLPVILSSYKIHPVSFLATPPPPPPPPRSYPSRPHNVALNGVSLTLQPGKLTALVGGEARAGSRSWCYQGRATCHRAPPVIC